ncbi:hypothetical protein EDB81DRAFT_798983 [Dactylonectria macrodidyma]|uniref:Uncharacterized protein n=1 Tax=Dactylonectria macrodidyma TaxID=307937 RepID=A0A9P9J3M1_9HYPO|nr:hypothetical protein EDB81DRAFT_798983 [Dactylonectria macrodidyma]
MDLRGQPSLQRTPRSGCPPPPLVSPPKASRGPSCSSAAGAVVGLAWAPCTPKKTRSIFLFDRSGPRFLVRDAEKTTDVPQAVPAKPMAICGPLGHRKSTHTRRERGETRGDEIGLASRGDAEATFACCHSGFVSPCPACGLVRNLCRLFSEISFPGVICP